ncbi:hypothetical protein GYMLUDRAFT_963313 [Collybiopsis luxurians FD-317 M1]|uniref:ferric-chelate reductase (NADPH) n=1 Tax=Collybiopsis luxurians FD-317 M1 TaxID=944289 RepID=A0A0D0BDM2_9AGAR|nr:hypothetical protein GYMLUDRAFT_963313 [Collybiopsis luxurians FD-317 M1]
MASNTYSSGAAPTVVYFKSTVDDESFLYHVNLFLIALFGVVVLFRLPRFTARLWKVSEWTNGHLLHHTNLRRSATRRVEFNSQAGSRHRDLATDDSHWSTVQRVSEKGAAPSFPPHVSSCPRFCRGLFQLLQTRFNPGMSLLQVMVIVIYLSVVIYPSFYKTNPFTDPKRYGWIGVTQFPFVFAFAMKNNVLALFLGTAYEKLHFLHRVIGRVIVLSINVHGLGYIYQWTLEGVFVEKMASPSNYWGLIALICADMLFFFSTSWWRTKAYQLFLCTHIFSIALILPATVMHKSTTTPYVLTAVGLYVFDIFMRWIKTRLTTAIIRPLPELGMTRVEIPSINAGWRAGQHVRLRVLSSGMGLLGWSEVHPFTIASIVKGEEGMILMCKKAGDWTNKLFDLAKLGGYEDGSEARQVKVMVDGPYGGPGHRMFASFSAAVFIAGGSGISFALSAVQDLIQKDLEGGSRVKVIQLVWSVQDPASLVPMLPLLTSLVQQSVFTPIRIAIFYTRAPIGKFPFSDDFFRSTALTLSPGRPKVSKILEACISKAVTLGSGAKDNEAITGMIVGVCGPVGLADSVVAEVGKVDPTRRDQVGGIEVHEETFGW